MLTSDRPGCRNGPSLLNTGPRCDSHVLTTFPEVHVYITDLPLSLVA